MSGLSEVLTRVTHRLERASPGVVTPPTGRLWLSLTWHASLHIGAQQVMWSQLSNIVVRKRSIFSMQTLAPSIMLEGTCTPVTFPQTKHYCKINVCITCIHYEDEHNPFKFRAMKMGNNKKYHTLWESWWWRRRVASPDSTEGRPRWFESVPSYYPQFHHWPSSLAPGQR